MKTKILLTTFFLLLFIRFSAQENFYLDYDNIKRNHIYIEAYLVAPDYISSYVSVNYEYTLGAKKKKSLRISFYPNFEDKGYTFPLTINWLTAPQKKHHFEYGFGPVLGFESDTKNNRTYFIFGGALIPLMYRFQKEKGIIFRTGINVFLSYPTIISPSISLGYKF
ncbi:MAG: hypothetical protein L3J74_04705 [Bacteroidales bacterium]|nr:hypothetical protein [Bacteroidales bacterium]